MKQGKKLERKHKEFLEGKGLDCRDYLVERKDVKEDTICFIHRDTNERLLYRLSEI